MPVPTPFHPRTAAACTSLFWKEWAGCHAVRSYDTTHDREYFALRHAVGLIDVSPLYKYELHGPDAGALLSWVLARDARKLKVGRVGYVCWCDDDGKVADDGTVSRLDDEHWRLTAAEPALAWLLAEAGRYRVTIEDSTRRLAAVAVQGPSSRDLLRQVADCDLERLKFFGVRAARVAGVPGHVSRTGYTGDLGYEVWVDAARALEVWDALTSAGRPFLVEPVGLDALDVARLEAGFIMNGVDYFSAHHCLNAARKSSPYELGLDFTVELDREPFIGQAALRAERARGARWATAELALDWDELEALFAEHDLPPRLPAKAWRDPVPVYGPRGKQVGYATSGAWSPLLKRNLALATLEARHAAPGTRLRCEVTVEFRRRTVEAVVIERPPFDPPRKRG